MKQIYEARMKAELDKDIVIFLIGMRISRLWRLHKWLPVSLAMRVVDLSVQVIRFDAAIAAKGEVAAP